MPLEKSKVRTPQASVCLHLLYFCLRTLNSTLWTLKSTEKELRRPRTGSNSIANKNCCYSCIDLGSISLPLVYLAAIIISCTNVFVEQVKNIQQFAVWWLNIWQYLHCSLFRSVLVSLYFAGCRKLVLQEVPICRSLVDSDLPHSSHPTSLLHQQQVGASKKWYKLWAKKFSCRKIVQLAKMIMLEQKRMIENASLRGMNSGRVIFQPPQEEG